MKTIVTLVVVLALLAGVAYGGWWGYRRLTAPRKPQYSLAPVERGEMVVTIGATGTIEPEEVVDVGAQVAGLIMKFGLDADNKPVDYRSPVNERTILANIDDSVYALTVKQALAQVDLAKAGVVRAKADLEQNQAKLHQAQRDWERAQRLGPSEALAQTLYDGYEATYETAKANVDVSAASIVQAQATQKQAEASLALANRNLDYCTIVSPVKGVVIDRRVNVGQTVVSSLNAPSLFLIAKDLRRIQVWVAVNEADIASIRPGQPVTFTVDALPGQTFKGEVDKVRLNAGMTQNVVTYPVVVTADNSSGILLPYQTANVQFEVSRKPDVLQVPNAALRWSPLADRIAPDARGKAADSSAPARGRRGGGATSRPYRTTTRPEDDSSGVAGAAPPAPDQNGDNGDSRGTVWVVDGDFVRPIPVRLGGTDGVMREVSGKELRDDMQVIVGEVVASSGSGAGGGTNPFTPQFPQRRRPGS